MSKPSLLFVSSEVYPFAKSGGLADVAHALPRALNAEYTLEVCMPLYSFVEREKYAIQKRMEHFDISMGGVHYPVEIYGCNYEGIEYRFIDSALLCEREYMYGTPEEGYADNALRFGLFAYAVVALLKEEKQDIVHLNDWQSALVALLIKEDTSIKTKSLFTIHNLAYQGIFAHSYLHALDLDTKHFAMDAIEFYHQISFIKAGIAYADAVTTVSKRYAQEILTPEFGCGLEGFLKHHKNKLSGIINGIDTEHFAPAFSDLKGKAQKKKEYLKEVSLRGVKKPLFVFIGRFTWQKGMDLFLEALESMAAYECNIAILGQGESVYTTKLQELAHVHKNIHLSCTYDESLSLEMYGAADFLLMPSLFEPCGLNQMIAMHYGALPLVHHVGGLKDTVQSYKDFDDTKTKAYGIAFKSPNLTAFLGAFEEALELFANKREYNKILKHNMLCDFSWDKSAKVYSKLYKIITQGEKL
ncbi:MAG: glycogen/starch synthase [Sulfurimonas sp.]|nr:glycogen/starch synthase [Sulfurimonas sp.]